MRKMLTLTLIAIVAVVLVAGTCGAAKKKYDRGVRAGYGSGKLLNSTKSHRLYFYASTATKIDTEWIDYTDTVKVGTDWTYTTPASLTTGRYRVAIEMQPNSWCTPLVIVPAAGNLGNQNLTCGSGAWEW